jgi:1A family penicillin-binding protein
MHHSSFSFRDLGRRVASRARGLSRTSVIVLVLVAGMALAGVFSAGWFAWSVWSGLPTRDELRQIDMAHSTSILDASDRPVFTIFQEQRVEVPLSEMSPHLVRALIAIEDQRFYEHRGIDTVRIMGAAMANLREGRRAQGGSTITQQLARQSFLTTAKTFRRKIEEAIVAARLERAYTKDEILELYLNKVYFGAGLYGAQAASLGFFGKPASDLTVAEAALLAGLVKSPSTWAPTVNMERAVARRNVVLQAMADSGAITADEATVARAEEVALEDALRHEEAHGAYFQEQVRLQLVEQFGWERVYNGGLRVYTTLDVDMQKAAEQAVTVSLERLEAQRAKLEARSRRGAAAKAGEGDESPEPPPLQAALVALDPKTGEVRALVGGRDFEESRFNRAVQARRQPGSAFKPFVFAAALEQGFSPASVIDRLNEPLSTPEGAWVPEDESSGASWMTLRTALRTSSNRAAVRLLERVGITPTVDYAQDMGVGALPKVPSLALGSGEVTVISITGAFTAFANEGQVVEPILIRRVEERDGTVVFQHEPKPRQVISKTTAFLVSSMMSDVITMGTASRARREGFQLPAAGKTGTTNDYHDAWFIGYTPNIVTGVWVGFDQPQTIMRNAYASEVAVPLWARFMKEATKGHKPEWYSPPAGVVGVNVCRLSGLLPNDGCNAVVTVARDGAVQDRNMIYTDYFVRGQQPRTVCHLHPSRAPDERLASAVGSDGVTPVQVSAPAAASAPVATTGQASSGSAPAAGAAQAGQAETAAAEPERRRRGFWSRVFGRGGGDRDRERDQDRERQQEERRRDR